MLYLGPTYLEGELSRCMSWLAWHGMVYVEHSYEAPISRFQYLTSQFKYQVYTRKDNRQDVRLCQVALIRYINYILEMGFITKSTLGWYDVAIHVRTTYYVGTQVQYYIHIYTYIYLCIAVKYVSLIYIHNDTCLAYMKLESQIYTYVQCTYIIHVAFHHRHRCHRHRLEAKIKWYS